MEYKIIQVSVSSCSALREETLRSGLDDLTVVAWVITMLLQPLVHLLDCVQLDGLKDLLYFPQVP